MEKKNTILLTVIAIATLLVAVIGATFAYFTATVSVDPTNAETKTQTVVKAATLGVVYHAGDKVDLGQNVLPGATKSNEFSIENTGDVAMDVNINWESLTNTFTTGNLVYTLTDTDTGATVVAERAIPTTAGLIVQENIPAGATKNYTLTVELKDTDAPQNDDQGKSFDAKIDVQLVNSEFTAD